MVPSWRTAVYYIAFYVVKHSVEAFHLGDPEIIKCCIRFWIEGRGLSYWWIKQRTCNSRYISLVISLTNVELDSEEVQDLRH